MHVRIRSSVKATAERIAQADGRSLANWLERMIEAEAARQDGKKLGGDASGISADLVRQRDSTKAEMPAFRLFAR